jgi:hypothetical protein
MRCSEHAPRSRPLLQTTFAPCRFSAVAAPVARVAELEVVRPIGALSVKRIILPALLAIAFASAADDPPRTIVTTDGTTYAQARVTELRPSGVAISTDSGIAVIPYAQLPADLQTRYGPNTKELAKAIGKSLNGTYEMPRERTGLGGERIILSDGGFVYQSWSDVGGGGELRGRFTTNDHWITFHHRGFPEPSRVLAVIAGRLSLLMPEDFKLWRETGDIERIMYSPLHRIAPE